MVPSKLNLSRRALLSGLAILPLPAFAFGPASQPDVAEIQLAQGTLSRPGAWQRLLYELIQATSVEANPQAIQCPPEDPLLFEHPFSVIIGDGALPEMNDTQLEQLRRYLAYGGFILADDTSGDPQSPFARSLRRLCSRLFPNRPLAPLPGDHSIYRAFFLLERPVGRLASQSVLEGVTVGPITPLVYCANDLSGALDRGPDGRPRQACVPGGEYQRRESVKLGINLFMYSLTSNYKHDQAHVAELLRAGRLE